MDIKVKDIIRKSDRIVKSNFINLLIPVIIVAVIDNIFNGSGLLLGLFVSIITGIVIQGASIEAYLAKKENREIERYGFYKRFTENKELLYLVIEITIKVFLWTLLFIVPGIIKSLQYQRAYYIKIENPELDSTECIRQSAEQMYGKKSKLFFTMLRIYLPLILFTIILVIVMTPAYISAINNMMQNENIVNISLNLAIPATYAIISSVLSFLISIITNIRKIPAEAVFNLELNKELGINDDDFNDENIELPNLDKYRNV